ncbi:hypothetical protein ACFSCV_13535 [Methylopila henanensis]|uniref:Uncharacterized protein n=1 Tax=Methylopila henanensis TaxID=873516 RepID=A0ABW4KAN5_9HYPH
MAASPTQSSNWWRTAADRSLSRSRAAPNAPAQNARRVVAAETAPAERRSLRRSSARRSAAARRDVARVTPLPPERGGLAIAVSAAGAAAGPGAEVVKALGDDARLIDAQLGGGTADLAVSPSLDGAAEPDVQRVARLFDAVVVIVARRDVAGAGDLAGKPIEIGAAEDDAAVARKALALLRLEGEERRSGREEALDAVSRGEAAGAVLIAVKGDADLGALIAAHGDLHVVSVAPDVDPARSRRLTPADLPSAPLVADARALTAEISLFAKRGADLDKEAAEAVQTLYARIPDMLAGGAGPWWRDVPLAAEISEAALWTPVRPDLASAERGHLAQGLERAGAERAREVAARPGARRWIVAP